MRTQRTSLLPGDVTYRRLTAGDIVDRLFTILAEANRCGVRVTRIKVSRYEMATLLHAAGLHQLNPDYVMTFCSTPLQVRMN